MPPYLIVMIVLTIAFALTGMILASGETGWLKSFDRAVYKDRKAYAKFLGKSTASLGISTLGSGLISLITGPVAAGILMAVGIIATIVIIAKKSKDYYL